MAHELGHLLMHAEGTAFRDDTFSGNPEEAQANAFAAALLMPPALLDPWRDRIASSSSLARLFQVSEPAMAYRLNKLYRDALPEHLS